MKDNLQKYYEYLKSVNADVPSTFESFQKTLSDEVSAQKYFDYLKENKFDAPDTFESFSTTLGLKKKDISEVTGTPSEVSLPEQPPLPSKLQTPDLTLQTPELGGGEEIPNYLEIGGDIPRPQPEKAKTVGEAIGATLGEFGRSFGEMFGDFGKLGTKIQDEFASIFLNPEQSKTFKKARETGAFVPPGGMTLNPSQHLSNLLAQATINAKELPSGVISDVTRGMIHIVPDLVLAAGAPELLLPKVFGKIGLTKVGKFGFEQGFRGMVEGMDQAEDAPWNLQISIPVLTSFERGMAGWMYEGLGRSSSLVGQRMLNKLMPNAKTVGELLNKSLLEKGATALTNGLYFMGYGGLDEFVRTGRVSKENLYSSFGMGFAFSMPEMGNLLYAKGINSFMAAPREGLNNIYKSDVSAKKLSEKSIELAKSVEEGKSENPESDAVTAFMLNKTSQLKALVDEVKENPKEIIKSIDESTLEPKVKELITDKVNEVIADNDVNIQKTKKYTDDITLLDGALDKIRKNKSWSEGRKEAESAPLKRKREELKKKELEVYGIKEPEPKEGEVEKKEKPLTKEDKVKIDEVLKKEEITKVEEEIKDAETIRREAEEAGRPQELVKGEKERLRLRRAEEDRVEAEQREEVVPQIGDIITAQGKMGTWEITGFKEDGTVIIRPLEHVVDSETRYYIQPNDITETVFKTPPKPKEAVTGEEVKSILNQETDLKGQPKEGWMYDYKTLVDEFKKKVPLEGRRKIDFSDSIQTQLSLSETVKEALSEGRYQQAISEGRMTANDAKVIIESAGLEVPQDILKMTIPAKPEVIPQEQIIPAPEQLKKKEAEIKPVKAEKPREEVGVKFKNKSYVSVEAVQDDFAEGKLTFKEQNQVLEEVRKFEDGLKVEAKKKSTKAADKLGMLSKDAENNSRKKVDNILQVRLIPPDIVSLGNTALWKQLIKPRDAVANWMAGRLQAGVQSQNDVIRWVTKSVTNLYGGFLRTERDILRKLEMVGTTKEFAPLEASQIQVRLRDIVNSDPESLRRVRDALDPEIAKEQITYDNLSASEQNLFNLIRDLNTWVHETNYADGFLPTDTYLKFKDADGNVKYIARMYDEYEIPSEITEFIKRGNNATSHKLNVDIFKMRKEIDDWKKEHAIEDPAYLTTKRVMQTIQNHAIKEYMDFVASEHPDFVREVKTGGDVPKGFTKLSPSYRWGDMRNKAIVNHILEDFTGYFYASKLIDATYDALKLWDRTKLNQFYKKWHTVYNPFVQLGNMTGNVFFASISGINPVQFISEIPNAIRDANKGTAEYKSLLRSGIMGATGITGDMTPITSANKNMVENMTASQEILSKAVNILTKADDFAIKLYQGADNVAKFAAYRIFREQGLTHEQAIRRTYDSFQNYATVGKTWDVASKTPYLGNKFIKFQADLQRILLNGITTSPLTTVGTLMLVSLLGTVASKLSGEGEEEKKVREQRKGVAKIPLPFGMSVPLSFKVGKKELNVARYLSPLYLYRYGDSDADLAEISKFFPFQFQKVERPQLGERGYVPSWSDPTLGWIAQVVSDRDFRGASIRNPQATKYFNPNPTNEEKIANVMNYVARAQLPFYKSTQDILDGITGQLDYYGRKRTWSDAILNNIIRIQEFDKPELKKYIEGNIGYLTNRFAGLSESMGNTNASFLKEINRAKEQGLSKSMQQKLYKTQDEIRTKRLAKSLEAQVPVMEELERLVSVYKKWYSDDPFVQENFLNIEAGRNRRFDVLNDIDLQKKYKDEYLLIKNNGLLRKPEIPNYFQSQKLTEEQKKRYSSIYWSEYVRNLDNFIGLTDEEIAREKEIIVTIIEEMGELPKERTSLQQKALHSAREAKIVADGQLEIILQSEK